MYASRALVMEWHRWFKILEDLRVWSGDPARSIGSLEGDVVGVGTPEKSRTGILSPPGKRKQRAVRSVSDQPESWWRRSSGANGGGKCWNALERSRARQIWPGTIAQCAREGRGPIPKAHSTARHSVVSGGKVRHDAATASRQLCSGKRARAVAQSGSGQAHLLRERSAGSVSSPRSSTSDGSAAEGWLRRDVMGKCLYCQRGTGLRRREEARKASISSRYKMRPPVAHTYRILKILPDVYLSPYRPSQSPNTLHRTPPLAQAPGKHTHKHVGVGDHSRSTARRSAKM